MGCGFKRAWRGSVKGSRKLGLEMRYESFSGSGWKMERVWYSGSTSSDRIRVHCILLRVDFELIFKASFYAGACVLSDSGRKRIEFRCKLIGGDFKRAWQSLWSCFEKLDWILSTKTPKIALLKSRPGKLRKNGAWKLFQESSERKCKNPSIRYFNKFWVYWKILWLGLINFGP